MNLLHDSRTRELINKAVAQGWVLTHRSKSLCLKSPDGKGMVTLPCTPSDRNSYYNILRNLRKNGYKE
jgi:hypothetical protein